MQTIEIAENAKKALNNTPLLEDGSNMIVHYSSLQQINLQNQYSGGIDYQLLKQNSLLAENTSQDQKKKSRWSILSSDTQQTDILSVSSNFTIEDNNLTKDSFIKDIANKDNDCNQSKYNAIYPSKDELLETDNSKFQDTDSPCQMQNFSSIFNSFQGTSNSSLEYKIELNFPSFNYEDEINEDTLNINNINLNEKEVSSSTQNNLEENKEIIKEQILQKIETCTTQSLNQKMQTSLSKISDLIIQNQKKKSRENIQDQLNELQFDPSLYVNQQFINENLKSKVIYIRGIKSKEIKALHLYNMFSNFGNIIKIIIVRNKQSALIEYEILDFSTFAKDMMNNQVFYGQQLKVFYSHHQQLEFKNILLEEEQIQEDIFVGTPENFRFNKVRNIKINPPSQILHISNISQEIFNTESIIQCFLPFGIVENVKLLPSLDNKNMGFVKLQTIEMSLNAVANLHGNTCLKIDRSVCVGQKGNEIGLDSVQKDLIGHWKFDDAFALDTSNNKNDMTPPPEIGPQSGGKGHSAYFSGETMSQLKHINDYSSEDMTICFWIFLIQLEQEGGWRTIINKGSNPQELTPSIQLWPSESRLHVRVSTDFDWNENVDSRSEIVARRWTQVVITLSRMLVQIYINGQLDSQKILVGQLRHNNGPFHIGKDPWHRGVKLYLEDLRFYNRLLKNSEITSLSSFPNIFQGEPYVVLGCESCTYNQALAKCPDKYHLCSYHEIYAGGFHIARIMGWFRLNPNFWARIDENEKRFNKELYDPNLYKLGLCCLNKSYQNLL